WPRGLVFDYGVPHPVSTDEVWPCAAAIAILLAATALAWRTRSVSEKRGHAPSRELAFLGTWFFVTLAPTSSFVPIATEVGAERRMYLPLAAVVVFVVCGGWSLVRNRRVRMASPAIASIALMALTIQRNAEYRSPTGIWQTVLDRRPHGRAHVNLGTALIKEGRREEAMGHYRQALTDAPEAHYGLGQQLEAEGRHDEAGGHLREYIRLEREDIKVLNAVALLGHGLVAQGRTDEAAAAFRE